MTLMLFSLIFSIALLLFALNFLLWPYDKNWENVFKDGHTPKTLLNNNYPQEWSIKMLTGPLPSMDFRPLKHRKRITDSLFGANILYKKCIWGFFLYEPVAFSDLLKLDYSKIQTNIISSHILDLVRATSNPDVLIGKFYYKLFGGYRFLGYFQMTRILKDNANG